jgi:hypothetical protein
MTESKPGELWYQTNLDIFLNRWFANYEDARRDLEAHGGFLLPYRHHFFVCKPEVVAALGLDPDDQDWEKIDFDCARPKDAAAFARLKSARERVVGPADSEDQPPAVTSV